MQSQVYPTSTSAVDGRTIAVEAQRRRERTGAGLPVHLPEPAAIEVLHLIAERLGSLSADKQCHEVMDALRKLPGGASVRDLEDCLCIGHAPRRIADLREAGHTIASEQVVQADAMGRLRRTVRYVLAIECRAGGAAA